MDVLQELRNLVAEDPTRRNRICLYVNADGTPSCIIGHLAARLGWPLPDFHSAGNRGRPKDVWPGRASDEDFERLLLVQAKADQGQTWADAIDGLLESPA